VKAPATRTAKSTKTATTSVKGRASQAKTPAVVSKAAGKAAAKAVVAKKAVVKPAAKPAAKVSTKPAAKPAKAVVAKKAAASVAPKSSPKAAVKAAAPKPVATRKAAPVPPAKPAANGKASAKPAAPAVVKPAKPAPKAAPAPAPKAAAKAPAKVSPPPKAAAPAVPAKSSKAVAAPVAPAPAPRPAPAVVEPTPRPLGKRAAKKVMMEQMTQAAVVPTHAPDAAKATFSTMNDRVMTPPAPSSIQKDPKRANNWKTLSVDQLTDQDVQAMPDSEYMNDVQLAFFRRKLSLLKADMLANAGETTEHLREDTVVVPDPADRATIEEEHALELRTRDRERKLLKKIEQAISRIDSGDYGYCEETGEPIGVGRLMARPTASLSLEAQQRRELKQKMFGD
jgi:DnaK suppressor protein